ncbi:MAG: S24 family peptidase [Spartobacteria bacterium]|nr:S24 family peptidase [Spartobacteria bacterium]
MNEENDIKLSSSSPKEPDYIEFPPEKDRFTTCLPFFDLEAAAGPFGYEQNYVEELQHHEKWVRFDGKITRDLFPIRIKGHSMEPRIPDGSIAVFQAGNALAGSRQGKIVLVQLLDRFNRDTNSRFTVKKYESSKKYDKNGVFEHQNIVFSPLNPDF